MDSIDKAKELVEKFRNFEYPSEIGSEFNEIHKNSFGAAKRCALIAVEEIINSKPGGGYMTDTEYISTDSTDYWQQVKEEIEQL